LSRADWKIQQQLAGKPLRFLTADDERQALYKKCAHDAQVTAKWLVDTYSIPFLNQGSGVLDVAGGIGELSLCLALLGVQSTVVDPRPTVGCLCTQRRKALGKALKADESSLCEKWPHVVPFRIAQAWFARCPGDDLHAANEELAGRFVKYATGERTLNSSVERVGSGSCAGAAFNAPFLLGEGHALIRDCSLVVGLHPDQVTDDCARLAELAGKHFAVVPCCVFASENFHRVLPGGGGEGEGGEGGWAFRPVTSRADLVAWLQLGLDRVQGRDADRRGAGSGGDRRMIEVLDFCGANTVVWTGGGRGEGVVPV
jgi:hypothetical protein